MHKRLNLYKSRLNTAAGRNYKLVKKASRHPFMVPVFVFFGLLFISIAAYIIFKPAPIQAIGPKLVIINHDHIQQVVPTIEPTVGALLSKLHLPPAIVYPVNIGVIPATIIADGIGITPPQLGNWISFPVTTGRCHLISRRCLA